MKIIKADYTVVPEIESLIKKIELVARTCYKSEDLITEDSAIRMVKNLIKSKHYAMLEHASLVFEVDSVTYADLKLLISDLEENVLDDTQVTTYKSYLRFTSNNGNCYVSGNIRAWLEFLEASLKKTNKIPVFFKAYITRTKNIDNEILFGEYMDVEADMYSLLPDFVSYERITDFSKFSIFERLIHEDLTIKFIVDRGITHELVRMRDCSFAQESTRYCNYSKGKYGEEITVIEPCFWEENSYEWTQWKMRCEQAEQGYFDLMSTPGVTAQQARDVLPTSVKADIFMTANINEWIHILELRALETTGKAHPQILEVMVPVAKELTKTRLSDFVELKSVKEMLLL